MGIRTIDDLFLDELKDLYSAEKRIAEAFPKLARAATSDELRAPFRLSSWRGRDANCPQPCWNASRR
jgi:ferritin-like metal-binding protein YciE